MKKEFVMRGQTASGETEVLNFGIKDGYAFRLVDLTIYPSVEIGSANAELALSITAAKTFEDPSNPNFNNEGLIAVAMLGMRGDIQNGQFLDHVVINDTFLITQNLILAAIDTETVAPMAVNWQCKFMPVKLSENQKANQNYRQFMIFDE